MFGSKTTTVLIQTKMEWLFKRPKQELGISSGSKRPQNHLTKIPSDQKVGCKTSVNISAGTHTCKEEYVGRLVTIWIIDTATPSNNAFLN
ncbi:hypothetical protein QTP88_026265 [Uroleucon formosanum]